MQSGDDHSSAQPDAGGETFQGNALLRMLDDFRLTSLTLENIEQTSPRVVRARSSSEMYCYMTLQHPVRLRVPPHTDLLFHPGDHVIVLNGASHVLETLDGGTRLDIHASCQQFNQEHTGALLRLLPTVVVDRGQDGQPSAALTPFVALLEKTSIPIDAENIAMIRRLAELTFIHTIRSYVNELISTPNTLQFSKSLLQIGPALSAMRRDLKRNWTLTDLALAAGISKTVLVEGFNKAVGQTPHKYLTTLRMTQAVSLIEERLLSLSQIAYSVGYNSDAHFSRVFKQHFGVPPGKFRHGDD